MTAATTVANIFELDLRADTLLAAGYSPLVAGDTWTLRLQIRDADNDAVTLTGATIWVTIKQSSSEPPLVTRKSGVTIYGSSPARDQIAIDADQSAESTDTLTGKGWFEVRFGSEVFERSALMPAIGVQLFDLMIEYADDTRSTHARGRIEILRPYTDPFHP